MPWRVSIPRIRWSPSMRLTVLGLALGASAAGVLSVMYLLRRRRRSQRRRDDVVRPDVFLTSQLNSTARSLGHAGSQRGSQRGSLARSRRPGSVSSRASTLRSAGAPSGAAETAERELSAEDCGVLGLRALRHVIDKLEDALFECKQFEEMHESTSHRQDLSSDSYHSADSLPGIQQLALMQDLRLLLQEAYRVKERWKQRVILQTDAAELLSDLSRESDDDDDDDDTESFVSASEFIDLSDLDALLSQTPAEERYLYRAGLLEIDQGNVTCRSLRTKLLGCDTDSEFLAKVHCLRLAFDNIMADSNRRRAVERQSRRAISTLLQRLGCETDGFHSAYDTMIEFLEQPNARLMMAEELGPRGVKKVNFYDVVIDNMFLDSFEDLEHPPASLVSVINNRWLSNGFKKTALESAVWTILLTKRKFLKRADGFVAHYYTIAGEVTPALAWGFLGPDEELREVCSDFKDRLLRLAHTMFSFAHMRFTTVDELSDDVFALYQEMVEELAGDD